MIFTLGGRTCSLLQSLDERQREFLVAGREHQLGDGDPSAVTVSAHPPIHTVQLRKEGDDGAALLMCMRGAGAHDRAHLHAHAGDATAIPLA